jgi:uncharacterized small protein (DUF1192 family)
MYGNEILAKESQCGQVADNRLHNPTVGDNLELRIKVLKEELARLEASRETLGPLMNMRIRDIRDAMNY